MTNAPSLFSSTSLPANVMLLTNSGNTSMTACERLDENDISTTRCNEVITCTTPTDKHAHKNIVTSILVSSPSWGLRSDFSPSIENNSFPPLLQWRNHRQALEFLTPESDTIVQACNINLHQRDAVLGMVVQQAC